MHTFADLSNGFQYTAIALCATSSIQPTRHRVFRICEVIKKMG